MSNIEDDMAAVDVELDRALAPTNLELDAAIADMDRKRALAPVTYIVKLHGPLALALENYAASESLSAETIIREAVRTYIGDAA